MDWLTPAKKLGKKYSYALLILLLGILFLMLPSQKDTSAKPAVGKTEDKGMTTSEELAAILSKIQGVGKTQVMLTVAAGEETIYQSDQKSGSTQQDFTTVTVTDAQRNETGLIRQVNPPNYLGAIVVCEGADSPAVCLQVMEAVSRITGLGMDRISVLKMK